MADPTVEMRNQVVLESLFSEDSALRKEAQETANTYLKRRAYEDGIMRAYMNPPTITVDELDPQVNQEAPTKIYEIEPDTAASYSVPFSTQATALEVVGRKGLVVFHKITTPRHRKDKFLLAGYKSDIRQIITDNDLKLMLAEEDGTTFAMIDHLLSNGTGVADQNITDAGSVPLWKTISGGLTPTTIVDILQILPNASPHFETHTLVMNHYLAKEMLSWSSLDLGDNLKQELVERGWVRKNLYGYNLLITIKKDIVANDEVYVFARPEEFGKFWILEDATLYPEAHGSMLEWWSEEVVGLSFQAIGCGKATITA